MDHRLTRTCASAVVSLLFVVASATPGIASSYPKHRDDQWWFVAWNIENQVWPLTQGSGVTVAVLDTGIEAGIPELSGVVMSGFDAVKGSGDGREDLDTDTPPGHGTSMANLIAAQGGRNRYLGVAPKAKILPVTVHYGDVKEAVAPGIRFAVEHGAKVINLSVFSPATCPDDVQDAVSYALQHDVVVVAGAGNTGDEGNPSGYPANCMGVLAVGAINYQLKPWEKTQSQQYVAVSAPGVNMVGVLKDGDLYEADGGTSAASALTSGAVALVRSKYPKMSAREVVQRIIASTRDAGPPGKDDQTGYGVVRPYQALVNKVPKDAPNPVFAAYDEWAKTNGKKNTTGVGSENEGSEASGLKELSSNPVVLALGGLVILGIILVLVKVGRSKPAQAPVAWGPPGAPQVPQQQGPPQQFGPPSFGQPPMGTAGHAPAGWPQAPAAPQGPGAPNPSPPPSPYGPPDQGRP